MRRTRLLAGITVAAMLAVTACGNDSGGGGSSEDENALTVWTTEDAADRVATQQEILNRFGASSGTTVKLVAVAEDQLTTVLTSAAAADDMPDVIGALSLNGVNQLATDELIDTGVTKEIVDGLGTGTFAAQALALTSAEGEQLGVPSDAWLQMLFYRKDLFSAAGLSEPKTYADLDKAAAQLKQGKVAGIVAGTAPADSFTTQSFEWLAQANGCQLVDDAGTLTLNSPNCQEAFQFYTDLIKNDSVKGNQDADTTRASYFAGDAAMMVWSSFLLDELAGLRNDALPTCDKCQDDPKWLAENTGVVTTLQGPNGTAPAAYGEIVSWAVLEDASPKAKDLVTYMMSEGYADWLGVAPEGKVPTRNGTQANPQEYVEAWGKLEAGVDTKELLSANYPPELLTAIAASPDAIQRWGIPQGQGRLAGAVAGQFVVPQALAKMINSNATAADATAEAQQAAEQIKTDLG